MASYIEYEGDAEDQEHSKIGGSALLPEAIKWPIDRHGRKMLFLASLSSQLLKAQCDIVIPEDQVLSIFCPYERDNIECAIDMARGRETGCVIAHFAKEPRQEFNDPIAEVKKLVLNEDVETDEDEFSEDLDDKIGGNPNWLQDRFDYTGYDFVLQISGLYFGKIIPTHKHIFMGGMFYVFYHPSDNKGLVTLQYS
ncbi:DUF1963 domain-containing protein [Chitinophaga sp. RAB17]|uniref:DUF1963 domain-containing protein n=1 Tax=Chitinophaga sp. RAB17 TaxID=3233049 RepID=UPI003F93101C